MQSERGVTLIEIIAVIAVFSILGVGLVEIYTSQTQRQIRSNYVATSAQMQAQFGDASVRFVEDHWSDCTGVTTRSDGNGNGTWEVGEICEIVHADIANRLPNNYGGSSHETPFGQSQISLVLKDSQNSGVPNPDAYRLLTTERNNINRLVLQEVGLGTNNASVRSIKFQNVIRLNRFYARPRRSHAVIFQGTTAANGANQQFSCDVSDYVNSPSEDRIALIYFDPDCSG